MHKQSQWLFETPIEAEATLYTIPYSNSEWEVERELQEVNSYRLGEKEWESSSTSPQEQTMRETISGFSRHSNAIPSQERAKIAKIAQMIVQSHRTRQPIRTVRLVGHADRDVQRGANFEKKISGDRALLVQKAIIAAVKNPSIASKISWQQVSAGASRLIVQNPKTEGDRLRNRRVEVFLSRVNSPNQPPKPPQPSGPPITPTGGGTPIPVIIVPGIMGTRLENPDGRMVWNPLPKIPGLCISKFGGFGTFAANFERLNSFSPLIPREQHDIPPGSLGGIVGCPTEFAQANAIPHFGNLIFSYYNRLAFDLNDPQWQATMLAGQSIKVYACGYDWRQDNADSARRLDVVVKQALAETGAEQVILVAHSQGGLVSRYYCKTGGESKVMGLILVASPTHGAPQAYRMLKEGISLIRDRKLGALFLEKPRFDLMQMMRRFPSIYQLLPSRHYCLSQPDWLQFEPGKTPLPDASKAVALYSDPHVGFLDGLNGGPTLDRVVKDALDRRQRFDETLFNPSAGCYMPRNTFLIFSNDIDTEAKYRLKERGSLGSKVLSPFNVVPLSNAPGDITVPEFSATAASCVATRFTFRNKVEHGELPNDPGVINFIKSIIRTLLIVRTPTTRSSRPLSVPIRR